MIGWEPGLQTVWGRWKEWRKTGVSVCMGYMKTLAGHMWIKGVILNLPLNDIESQMILCII